MKQLEGRASALDLAKKFARERSRFQHSVLFFCSSAGEYEQAKPLLDRLERLGNTFVLILFFSKSGFDFAKSRGERNHFALTPLTDSVWEWGSLFAAISPNITAIMRHEIWPGFLAAARAYSRVHLIDASCSHGERTSSIKRWLRKRLLKRFDRIFAVNSDDFDFFKSAYRLPSAQLRLVGETRYDRAIERSREKTKDVTHLQNLLNQCGTFQYRLIVGSAHKADVETIVMAYRKLASQMPHWQVILAPHHVTSEVLTWIKDKLQEAAIPHTSLSVLEEANLDSTAAPIPFVIIDRMGILAEAYALGQVALVGGAFHYQIHNVLEPACRGLALVWGPLFKNSHEAIYLVQLGLADVVFGETDLSIWWKDLPQRLEAKKVAITEAVAKLCGASDKIMTEWQVSLRSSEAG